MAEDPAAPLPATANSNASSASLPLEKQTEETQAEAPSRTARLEPAEALGMFGRYQLQRLLGQGGMGQVYLAHDTLLQRTVALKLPKFARDDEGRRSRFLREARAAATLAHPSICPVYDVGEVETQPYLTMAYIQGVSLAQHLREHGPMPPADAARLVQSVARAMHHAHQHGVLHRDLKPGNIQITPRGEPVVMDFGLAFRFDAPAGERVTEDGLLLGTPSYMPPEQINGEALGPAADVYSLGVVLYELVSGRLPFQGTLGQVLMKIENTPPPSLAELRADVDPALEALCLKALAKDADDRYASMQEFARALEGYLGGNPTLETLAPPRQLIPRRRVSRRAWLIAGGVLALLLVAGLLWRFGPWSETEGPSPAPAVTAPKRIYLSDLEPTLVIDWMKQPPHPVDKGGVKKVMPVFLGVAVKGMRSPHGIFMHPPPLPDGGTTKLGYSLRGEYSTFEAEVSLNDLPLEPPPWQTDTPITFLVHGDGRLLWQSRPISSQADADRCKVPVTGIDLLTLTVDCPGHPRRAHAVWIEPYVER